MERIAKQPTYKAPADRFTGDVHIDGLVSDIDGPGASLGAVHFTPGARTAWHMHHAGQTLYVVEGVGVVAERNGEVLEVRPGDVVHAPAGEWHWHGAASDHLMTHISITKTGTSADWGDHVTDEEYRAAMAQLEQDNA